MKVVLPAVAAALAVLVGGCGGAERHACVEGAATTPVSTPESGLPQAYLTGVSVVRAGCADRVSFTFADRLPGYRVEYVSPERAQTEDASGRYVTVAGSAFHVVRLANALTARNDGSTWTPTYAGPRRIAATGTRHARELVKTGDFEAVMTWAIGLDERRPFAVRRTGRTIAVEVG